MNGSLKIIYLGGILLVFSIVIYFTKGQSHFSNALWGSRISTKYLLHLFWSMFTGLTEVILMVGGYLKQSI